MHNIHNYRTSIELLNIIEKDKMDASTHLLSNLMKILMEHQQYKSQTNSGETKKKQTHRAKIRNRI